MKSLSKLTKFVLPYSTENRSFSAIGDLLDKDKKDYVQIFEESEYLGFQVHKRWEANREGVQKIIENPFMLSHFSDLKLRLTIDIMGSLDAFDYIAENANKYFEETKRKKDGFEIVSGQEISETNTEHSDRLLLLKKLDNEKSMVFDFGDFSGVDREKLLKFYEVNPEHIDELAHIIHEALEPIDDWSSLHDGRFMFDTEELRIGWFSEEENQSGVLE